MLKDHRKAEMVNELTAAAVKYSGTQQLRTAIRQLLLSYLEEQETVLQEKVIVHTSKAAKGIDVSYIGLKV